MRRGSLNHPESDRVFVLDKDPLVGENRVGIRSFIGDLIAGKLLELARARLKDDELRGGSKGNKDCAGVDDAPIACISAASAAASFAALTWERRGRRRLAPFAAEGSIPGRFAAV